jgi:hypothetical protein
VRVLLRHPWPWRAVVVARNRPGRTMPDGEILKGYTNPDGPTFEEWRKSNGSRAHGENRCQ